jgi:flagellum-specific peptidoglycan hydrolase FlgJ
MSPKEFTEKFLPFAKETQKKTGISAIAILAQAALESGWGKHAPGNMFFGVKDTDGLNGNEQLITTTEYSRRPDANFPRILKMVPVTVNKQKMFKYTIQDYFRKYETPEESFTHHAEFLLKNARYKIALEHKEDPVRFIEEVAKAGYATAPDYAKLLKAIVKMIKKYA